MKNKGKTIVIVPARGGSKGIPDKNLYKLRSQSLVFRAIRTSLASNIGEVIVSTNSERIITESEAASADRIIKRPKEISGDNSKTIQTVLHVIDQIEYKPNYIVIVQPTSPLRTHQDLIDSLDLMKSNVKALSLASVTDHIEPHPAKMFTSSGNYLQKLLEFSDPEKPRQKLEEVFRLNGCVYILSYEAAVMNKKILGEKLLRYKMPLDRSINIDSRWDIILIEALLRESEVDLIDY